MSVITMRDAMVARIAETIPVLGNRVFAHGGDFTGSELDRYHGKSPSVLVVCLGLAEVSDQGGDAVRGYRWGAFVVAEDVPAKPGTPPTPGVSKDDVALLIADALTLLVAYETWNGTAFASCDETTIKSRNLYSTANDSQAATIWVVTWEQAAKSGDHDLEALDDLLRFHTSFEISKPKGVTDPDDPEYAPDSDLRTSVPGPA